ncbi:hypothetical protein SDC9_104098 [bioreactor metagenome]|uniref:Uncharacterized protein n=1 Tax=bioreactor metagenome TaxID=1076179 RepID=A0A645AWV8_9ZZZZ
MDAEVAHAAVFAVGGKRALPVDGLCQIHVRRVLDGKFRFDDLTENAFFVPFYHFLHGGIKRKLTGAAHQNLRVLVHGHLNLAKRFQIQPERLFADQVLARADHVAIHFGVQMVRNRGVYRFHFGILQHLVIVAVKIFRVRIAAEPLQIRLACVARGNNNRARQILRQVQPAQRRACEFTPHQPAADDAETNGLFRHGFLPPSFQGICRTCPAGCAASLLSR